MDDECNQAFEVERGKDKRCLANRSKIRCAD